jgi:hypothetical protein
VTGRLGFLQPFDVVTLEAREELVAAREALAALD